MAYKKNSTVSETRQGVRSPMCGYEQQTKRRTPSTYGTTEMMPGTAPKPAKINSPNKSKASGGA